MRSPGRHVIDPDRHPLRLSQRPGFGRPKPNGALFGQILWAIFGLASLLFLTNPSHMILAFILPVVALASIVWIEWSNRNENQAQVNRVFAAMMAALALLMLFSSSRKDRRS